MSTPLQGDYFHLDEHACDRCAERGYWYAGYGWLCLRHYQDATRRKTW